MRTLTPLLLLVAACADKDTDDSELNESRTDTQTTTACDTLCETVDGCGNAEALGMSDCPTDCLEASDDQVACLSEALDSCDAESAQACIEQEEGAELPTAGPSYDEAGDRYGFVALEDLGCDATRCTEVIAETGVLSAAYARLIELDPDATPYVALTAGQSGDWIYCDPTFLAELFGHQDVDHDVEGVYTIVGFATDGETCATTEISDEESLNGEPGGICAHLSIAHSLVYQLTVVESGWSGVIDGANWDADFLRAIQTATGDTDGKRGKSRDETETAHEADWNQKWKVEQSLDWTEMPTGSDCDELKTWCDSIKKYLDEDDDCIISLRRASPARGHQVKINSASWDATNCKCKVEAVNTGKQDGSANDYENVPIFAAGKHNWEFGKDGAIGVTSGPSKNFWNLRYNTAAVSCYDEELRFEWPWETLENKAGSALD